MEDLTQFAIGVIGTLVLAIFLILGSASALQAWHHVHHQPFRSMAVDNIAAAVESSPSDASYWSGRR